MLAFFFRQLATLIGSGIPLVQAWQLLMADMPGRYRRPLHLAALQMEQGVCPSQAMDQCRAFPELACRLIRAGEQTGNLDTEDFFVSSLVLPGGSLLFVLFCTTRYGWGFDKYMAEVNMGTGVKMPRWVKPYFKYVLPILIFGILVRGLL